LTLQDNKLANSDLAAIVKASSAAAAVFPSLTDLDLSSNSFTNTLPPLVTRCHALTSLNLSFNKLVAVKDDDKDAAVLTSNKKLITVTKQKTLVASCVYLSSLLVSSSSSSSFPSSS
jgi:Leucine-rich repeat (LRR) protein